MCGIVGVLGSLAGETNGEIRKKFDSAIKQLEHRGPDGKGVLHNPQSFMLLGHTRLSILDLTNSASQPMQDAEGNVITFNGEIYNYKDIRENHLDSTLAFSSSGDTEVLLKACVDLGIKKTLNLCRGMFAFAYLDNKSEFLFLARDRFGEKPLYYYVDDGTLVFASEIKAILEIVSPLEIDLDNIASFLRFQYSEPGKTAFASIRQVLPGHFLKIPVSSYITADQIEDATYWSPKEVIQNRNINFDRTIEDSALEFLELLSSSVKSQLVSDVPIGAFLSGGIDSSLVVSLMKQHSESDVHSFSIGFDDRRFDESSHARAVADYIGTKHTEFIVSGNDVLELIPLLPRAYDDPFGDSSQLPTLLLSKLTREHVTVALSGDGADELFGGYNRYFIGDTLWKKLKYIPSPLAHVASRLVRKTRPSVLDAIGGIVSLGGRVGFSGSLSTRAERLVSVLDSRKFEDFYTGLVSHWDIPPIKSAHQSHRTIDTPRHLNEIEKMMYWDTTTYLPSDILTKVDRAAMSYSLETRAPFLTPEIFEFAWNLPIEQKVSSSAGKLVLKEALAQIIPSALWDRPKQGFGVPLGSWLRSELKEWAEDLLSNPTGSEFLDHELLRIKWIEHTSNLRNWEYLLWDILMLKIWIRQWKS